MNREFYKELHNKVRITPRKQIILQNAIPYLRPDLKVLDIGCGDGYIARNMDIFSKVTAFDSDVTNQKQHFPRVNFVDVLPDEKYDIVTLFDVLEHIPNWTRELRGFAEKSSKFVIINQPDQEDGSQPYDRAIHSSELITWMDDFGFTIIKLEHYKFSQNESYNFMVFRKSDTYLSSWY